MLYNMRVACFGVFNTTPDPYRKFACQFEFDPAQDTQVDRVGCYKFNTLEKMGNALITPAETTLKNAQDPDKDSLDNPLAKTAFVIATLFFTAPLALIGAGVKRLGECFNTNAKTRRLALAKLIQIRSKVNHLDKEKAVPIAMVHFIFVSPSNSQKPGLKSSRDLMKTGSSPELDFSICLDLLEIKRLFGEKILKGQKGISSTDLDKLGFHNNFSYIQPIPAVDDKLAKIFNDDIAPFKDIWLKVYTKAFGLKEITTSDITTLCNGNPDMQAIADKWISRPKAMEQRKVEVLRLCDEYNKLVQKIK